MKNLLADPTVRQVIARAQKPKPQRTIRVADPLPIVTQPLPPARENIPAGLQAFWARQSGKQAY